MAMRRLRHRAALGVAADVGVAHPADDEARGRVGRLGAEHALEHGAEGAALAGVERLERGGDGVGARRERGVGGARGRPA